MKMLRNRKTKALFPYSESLLKLNKYMEVYDTSLDEPVNDEPINNTAQGTSLDEPMEKKSSQSVSDSAIMIGDKSIYDAEKKDLIEYLNIAFDVTMPARSTKQELIDKIIELSA